MFDDSYVFCLFHQPLLKQKGFVIGGGVVALIVVAGIVLTIVNLALPASDSSAPNDVPTNTSWAPLILISSDGFRWDYLQRNPVAPNIQRLIANGVHARSMRPSFPSKTFPNHYTLVTGLYPSSHGIIDNTMYDPGTYTHPFCLLFSRFAR